ncbi:MAG: hypothetical protein GW886_05740 [Rhodobacterales bacterium]|nr:hypothetical protein [Rhodobacterales bacterium]
MTPRDPDPRLPRHRLDARIGWQEAQDAALAPEGLLAQGDRLHLVSAMRAADGAWVFAAPIPDTDPAGSFGGRTLPRGLVISLQGDVYLADPEGARILTTRAALPPVAEGMVPLYTLPDGPHPLRLTRPVALALVPEGAGPGMMADALVVADGARLVWIDRRQGRLRHVLALPAPAIALGVDAAGGLRVAVEGPALLAVRQGRITRRDALARRPENLHVTPCGTALLADQAGVWALDAQGAPVPPPKGPLTPPALVVRDGALVWPQGCGAPLRLDHLPLDRLGRLAGTALPLVTLPRRLPRPRRGTWVAGPFDGAARGFAWHRIALDATIPDQCRLVISTHVTDFDTTQGGRPGPADWDGAMAIGPGDLPEALVQRNRGRYLWLRIEAFGNGTDSAAITGIDIFGPRESQLMDLPLPYRQDAETADFLDRFLSLQDAIYAEALALYAGVGGILRPAATPEAYLDWLGGWFDWRFLAGWDAATRRAMIAQSMAFFDRRGTIAGLGQMLRWHLGAAGPYPVILEDYRLARAAQPLWIGGEAIAPGSGAHAFRVILPAAAAPDAAARAQIETIIAAQKPAHTVHQTHYITPALRPGAQATLGVDAILPDSRPQPLGAGRLGESLATHSAC